MYSLRPNLVIGFHGCDAATCQSLLNNPNEIVISQKPHDWLGHGMYFWENNVERALEWATDKQARAEIKDPSVIGAVLHLGYCLDFLDSRFIKMLPNYFNLMEAEYKILNKKIPQNKDLKQDKHKDKILRELDCALIEFMHQAILEQMILDKEEQGFSDLKLFESARGVFTEGGPAFPGAGIQEKNHIQICIRDPNCIKGFFLPRKEKNFLANILKEKRANLLKLKKE